MVNELGAVSFCPSIVPVVGVPPWLSKYKSYMGRHGGLPLQKNRVYPNNSQTITGLNDAIRPTIVLIARADAGVCPYKRIVLPD